jgi:hypothetical protein
VNPAGTTLGLLMTIALGDGIAGRFFFWNECVRSPIVTLVHRAQRQAAEIFVELT